MRFMALLISKKVNNFNFRSFSKSNKFYSMRNKTVTEINVYSTPDKVSRPDLKNQSHLKTTVPSIQKPSQGSHYSQFAIHHSKMRNYDDMRGQAHAFTDKRASKNQWELKQKVDEYEAQISLLREYLRGTSCNCVEKNSISRIFGFLDDRNELANEQQRVIKELGSKVRGLVKENATLKYQNAHYSQLNIEQIIQQNQKLQNLLQDYKLSDSSNYRRFLQQNQLLKDEIYRTRLEYEQKIKLMQIEHETRLSHLRANENQLLRKIDILQRTTQQYLNQSAKQGEKLSLQKLKQIEDIHNRQLKQLQNLWKKKLQDQQQYYLRLKNEWDESNKEFNIRMNSEETKRLKEKYTAAIHDVQTQQKLKLQKIMKTVQTLKKRLQETDQSIAHLKFQRQNRMQSTIRKSLNIASSSVKPKGEVPTQQPADDMEEQVKINTKPLSYSVSPRMSTYQADILQQRVHYLQKEITELKTKLSLSERFVLQKTQKILNLQNQIRTLNMTVHNLNVALNDAKNDVVVKEVVKEVPVTVPAIPKEYTEEVKNIKESIISCNLNNFDIFQTEFCEIIDQRNQMNQKLLSLKKEAKESSKVLILQKHLKVEREKNKQLQEHLKKYQSEVEDLKIQVIELQSQIDKIQSDKAQGQQNLEHYGLRPEELPDGKAGLQWQKVVKHCLVTSIGRLQTLQNKMKEDLTKSK